MTGAGVGGDVGGDGGGGDSGPVVVLVGPMGAGKSTVATALGELLGVPVADTDAWVEARAGDTVAALFATRGEPGFRELEHHAVTAALRTHRGVLALGGGAVLDPRTRAALRGRRVVFLDVSADEALRRMPQTADRPLLAAADPRAAWEELMAGRRSMYQQIATMRVDTTGVDAAHVAGRIAAGFGLVRHA